MITKGRKEMMQDERKRESKGENNTNMSVLILTFLKLNL